MRRTLVTRRTLGGSVQEVGRVDEKANPPTSDSVSSWQDVAEALLGVHVVPGHKGRRAALDQGGSRPRSSGSRRRAGRVPAGTDAVAYIFLPHVVKWVQKRTGSSRHG